MDTPFYYEDVCQKALDIRNKLKLSDTQTLLYNHVCRGDFKFRNENGQNFYDLENNGFGWHSDREWVKKQFRPLIRAGLVKYTSLHDCREGRYTSWYFWDPNFQLDDLVDASDYVDVNKLIMIKRILKLPDGFDKRNKIYGDLELIYDEKGYLTYTFKYKGEANIYGWDFDGKGIKEDLNWLTGKKTYIKPIYHETFSEMLHNIWSFLAHDGYKYLNNVPGYITYRKFKINN